MNTDLFSQLKTRQKEAGQGSGVRSQEIGARTQEPVASPISHLPSAETAGAGQAFHIENINGVTDFRVNIDGPGVLVATGWNGVGKSSAISAILAASGDKGATAEPTDGIAKGKVTMGEGVVFAVGSRRVHTGQPAIRLISAGSIGTLIDPQLVDEDRAAQARVRAVTQLMPMPADAAARVELTANDPELMTHIEHDPAEDALLLAESVRNKANEMALAQEKKALAKAGEMQTYEKLIGELGTVDFEAGDFDEVKALADAAINRSQVMAHTATERSKLERQQAEIRQTLGERPDSAPLVAKIDQYAAEIAEIDRQLTILRGIHQETVRERVRLDEAARRWDAQAEILKRPVEGPSLDEAEAARVEAEALAGRLQRASVLSQAQAYMQEHVNAERVKHEAELRAKALRDIARGTSDALGRLLERRGLPGLSIVEGRLCVKEGDTVKDFDKRLSFGQRVRVALGIALAGIDVQSVEHRTTGNRLPVLPLEPNFWTALDPAKRAEVAQIAKERGVCLITEQPGEGALRFEKVGNARNSATAEENTSNPETASPGGSLE